jgi:peptidoglycan hydrolase-like protein with peptidoglycan-binding domain
MMHKPAHLPSVSPAPIGVQSGVARDSMGSAPHSAGGSPRESAADGGLGNTARLDRLNLLGGNSPEQARKERAADLVADQVVRRANRPGSGATQPTSGSRPVLTGSLPEDFCAAFEEIVGRDPRSIPMHVGGLADAEADSLGARAFARDGAAFLPRSAWAPHDPAGQHLLAHELAHVALGHATPGAPPSLVADLALGTLRMGSRGPAVERLQDALVTLGHLSAANRATGPGIFGSKTHAAVLAFQRASGCFPDGIVGNQTETALEASLAGGAGAATRSPTTPAGGSTARAAPPPPLELGARGETVRQLQTALVQVGFSPGTPDGQFGPRTRDAVLAFQRAWGLDPAGRYGPQTAAALTRALAGARPSAAPSSPTSSAPSPRVATMLSWARGKLGAPYAAVNPYRFGRTAWPGGTLTDIRGNNVGPFPSGTIVFDCSGFVATALAQAGLNISSIASSSEIRKDIRFLSNITRSALQSGDLITYSPSASGVGHVVIFTGGNGCIHSSSPRGVIEGTVDWGRADGFKRPRFPT